MKTVPIAAVTASLFGLCVCYIYNTSIFLTCTLIITVYAVSDRILKRRPITLPPGPRGWPIIGNLLQVPREQQWIEYSNWGDVYGDIVYIRALSKHIIIINSVEVAKDLFDGRSTIYSDRASSTMIRLSGLRQFPILPHDDQWRRQRKIFSQAFNPGMMPSYHHIQELEACRLVYGLIQNPNTLISQTKSRIAAIIMRVTYGYTVQGENDPMITVPFEGMKYFSAITAPGIWMVDLIPQLRYLPRWTPRVPFIKLLETFREVQHKTCWEPYQWCMERIRDGTSDACLVTSTLSKNDWKMSDEDEAALVQAASSGLGGGLDTNLSTTLTFFLAMLQYPHVQAKAQAEIDSVIGCERLPTMGDRNALPYVRSLMTELYRWHPAGPLGVPHEVRKDDIYRGFLFPKSAIVITNIWRMLHDPHVFPLPDVFVPERYANNDASMRQVIDIAFGFGRRACPGVHFAEGTMFAIVATILATSTIVPQLDPHGTPIITETSYTSGIITAPEHVKCRVIPRSRRALALLEECIL